VRSREYDALIIGGRVAGGSLALLLAREGRRVLVVDRDQFPSDTLSTHFMAPPAVGLLRQLGVLEEVLAAGFRPITRHRSWFDDCGFDGPAGPGGAFSLAPRRNVLDALLIEHACRAGAEFRQRTRADGLITENGCVAGAVLTEIGGERHEVRAQVVVGADGKNSSVASWVGAAKYREVPGQRPAYYGYFHGIRPAPEVTLEMWFGGDQIGFLFPMRPGEDCIALEIQPDEFEAFRADARQAFEARVKKLPGMAQRWGEAELEGKLHGIRSVENYFRRPYGDGWALTGDAGYLKDPSTGLGVGDALQQSMLLGKAINEVFGGRPWAQALAAFQEERDALVLPSYEATLAFTAMRDMGPADLSILKAVLSSPTLARSLAAAVPAVVPKIFDEHAQRRIETIGRLFARQGGRPASTAALAEVAAR
jgi:flavin-dependent dehydrogenase